MRMRICVSLNDAMKSCLTLLMQRFKISSNPCFTNLYCIATLVFKYWGRPCNQTIICTNSTSALPFNASTITAYID